MQNGIIHKMNVYRAYLRKGGGDQVPPHLVKGASATAATFPSRGRLMYAFPLVAKILFAQRIGMQYLC